MFTPAGEKSRVTRGNRRSRLSVTDQPAVPLAVLPTYSFDSPIPDQGRAQTTRVTRQSLANAFTSVLGEDIKEDDTGSVNSFESVRTPKRRAPSLQELEASINRRRSLRSSTRSLDDTNASARSESYREGAETVSLDYEITQSSLERSIAENTVYDEDDEDQPSKETYHLGQAINNTKNKGPFKVKNGFLRSRTQQIGRRLDFYYFVFKRLCHRLSSILWRVLERCRDGLATLYIPSILPILMVSIAMLTYFLTPYLVQRYRSTRPEIYKAPSHSPVNMDEVVSRLRNVESSLASSQSALTYNWELNEQKIDKIYDLTVEKASQTHRQVEEVQQKLSGWHTALEEVSQQVSTAQQTSTNSRASVRDLTQQLQDVQAQIAGYDAHIRGLDRAEVNKDEDAIQILRDQISEQSNVIREIREQLVDESMVKGMKAEILNSIEAVLSARLSALLNGADVDDKPHSSFWSQLKKTLRGGVTKYDNHTTSGNRSALSYDRQLKDLVHEQTAKYIKEASGDGSLISKALFSDLLMKELGPIIHDLEIRLSEIATSRAKPNEHNPAGQVSQSALESMIRSAISRYSADVLARPDYASYLSGARINPFLTSPSFMHRPTALIPRLFSRVFYNIGSTWSHPPAIAIHPSNAVGMCWAFPGTAGQLSVKLASPIWLTDIAVEHVSPEIAHDPSTAPKEIEIWAQVADEHIDTLLNSPSLEHARRREQAPAESFVHIMDVKYNVYNNEPVQTFAVPASIRRSNIPVRQIVYRFRSNWGHEDYTCIYRVRAIGMSELQTTEGIETDENIL